MDGETDNQRQSRLDRNAQEQRRYDEEESASIKSETKKFNGMRVEEADKQLRSVLYLALGNEKKKIFGQKFTKVKILQIPSNRLRKKNKRDIRTTQTAKPKTTG